MLRPSKKHGEKKGGDLPLTGENANSGRALSGGFHGARPCVGSPAFQSVAKIVL